MFKEKNIKNTKYKLSLKYFFSFLAIILSALLYHFFLPNSFAPDFFLISIRPCTFYTCISLHIFTKPWGIKIEIKTLKKL